MKRYKELLKEYWVHAVMVMVLFTGLEWGINSFFNRELERSPWDWGDKETRQFASRLTPHPYYHHPSSEMVECDSLRKP